MEALRSASLFKKIAASVSALLLVAAAATILVVSFSSPAQSSVSAPARAQSVTFTFAASQLPTSAQAVTLTAIVPNVPLFENLHAPFIGDSRWRNANLPQVERTGDLFTFRGQLTAPALEGLFENMQWQIVRSDGTIVGNVVKSIEVSCSDGVFCNGIEKWIPGAGACEVVGYPCQDASANPDPCATYTCNEATKACSNNPIGTNCPQCKAAHCVPKCNGQTCGGDGCGGSCGTCTGGKVCISGACTTTSVAGSCTNPAPLYTVGGVAAPLPAGSTPGQFTVFGDNSVNTLDIAQPVCQSPGIAEYVYSFDVAPVAGYAGYQLGVSIQMMCADGTNGCDTLLAIHNSACQPFSAGATSRLCSDDASPPGGFGSRVDATLPPGTYTLIVSAYSSPNLGPFRLDVKTVANCFMKCEGKFCGSDDCGGSCGTCAAGFQCNLGRCQQTPCVPNCHARACGSDGCGGQCGVCKNKKVCNEQEGQCVPVKACDHLVPVCQGTGNQHAFCGSDCQWHTKGEPMPDLTTADKETILGTTTWEWASFGPESCALHEGCVKGTGNRLLMRFDTRVTNVGSADLVGEKIEKRPDLFSWAECHQHYHFQKFALFNLFNTSGGILVPGAKLSYCMEDTYATQTGSQVPCTSGSSCTNQGIARGRTDIYAGSLDCQWLDVTGVPNRGCWVVYEVCTNIGRNLFELTLENNCLRFPVYIPKNLPLGTAKTYWQAVTDENAMSVFPNGCIA